MVPILSNVVGAFLSVVFFDVMFDEMHGSFAYKNADKRGLKLNE